MTTGDQSELVSERVASFRYTEIRRAPSVEPMTTSTAQTPAFNYKDADKNMPEIKLTEKHLKLQHDLFNSVAIDGCDNTFITCNTNTTAGGSPTS